MRPGAAADRGRLRRLHRRALVPLLSFVWPASCFACARPLGPLQALGACAGCWTALKPLGPPVCPGCGSPMPVGTDLLGAAAGRCPGCLLGPSFTSGVRAAVVYDATARRFLLRAKFGARRELLAPLGAQLARVVADSSFARGCTAVVPVPTHPWTRLRRGFNPAAELAAAVTAVLGLPLESRLLRRRWRRVGAAKRLSAKRRREARRAAFVASERAAGQRILLVDDVLTTGATLQACAGSLLAAGAAEVRGAVWARAVLRV